jgi:hypothetical protein
VRADAPEARNTMAEPAAIKPQEADVKVDGDRLRFTLPPLSAAVVTATTK